MPVRDSEQGLHIVNPGSIAFTAPIFVIVTPPLILTLLFLKLPPCQFDPKPKRHIPNTGQEKAHKWQWPRIQLKTDLTLLVKLGPKEPGKLLEGSSGAMGIGPCRAARGFISTL